MKKLMPLILVVGILTSCSRGIHVETELDIEAGLNKYRDDTVHLDYLPEEIYSLDHTDLPEDFSDSSKALLNEKLYFNVPATFNSLSSSADFTPAYVNLKTGDLVFFCPDPLCTHDDDSECEFRHTEFPQFYDENTAFAHRFVYAPDYESQIIRITLSTGEVEVIFRCLMWDENDSWDGVIMEGIYGDILAFRTYREVESEDRIQKNLWQSWLYDIPTGEITAYSELSEEYVRYREYIPPQMPELLVQTYGEDGIYDWFETKEYVYFTKYDPVKLGSMTREGGKVFHVEYEHGGKIYRIPKDGMEEELVFDGGMELMIADWLVLGNHLYLMLNQLVNEGGEYHFLGMPGSMGIIRVNMTDHTMKYLTNPQ